MKFFNDNATPTAIPLIGSVYDFRNLEFIKEIQVADMVIALSQDDHYMEVVWGHDVPERLVTGEMGTPNIVYIAVNFDTDELMNVVNAVRTLKESVGVEHGQPRNSTEIGSRDQK